MFRLELRKRPSFTPKTLELFVVGLPRQEQTDRYTLIELSVEGLDQDPVPSAKNRTDPEFAGHQAARANFVRSHVSQRSRGETSCFPIVARSRAALVL